jgi:hypothetical protein
MKSILTGLARELLKYLTMTTPPPWPNSQGEGGVTKDALII